MINLFIQLHNQLENLGDRKIAFVLEGRDASGKGGFIKSLIKEDVPFTLKHQGKPTKTRNKSWLSDYAKQMPKKGELVIYDRSWHTRSWVQPALGFCTRKQYLNHISRVKEWEREQEAKGVEIIKNWISITKEEQSYYLKRRKEFKPYKWSETDQKGLELFEKITHYKQRMFLKCPNWNIVRRKNSKDELFRILLKATS